MSWHALALQDDNAEFFVQGAMVTVDRVINPPEPPGPREELPARLRRGPSSQLGWCAAKRHPNPSWQSEGVLWRNLPSDDSFRPAPHHRADGAATPKPYWQHSTSCA